MCWGCPYPTALADRSTFPIRGGGREKERGADLTTLKVTSMSVAFIKELFRDWANDAPAAVRESSTPLPQVNCPSTPIIRQRGASLIETSIAVGLVGIAVIASASTFGENISLKISRGILPALGGAAPSPQSKSEPPPTIPLLEPGPRKIIIRKKRTN